MKKFIRTLQTTIIGAVLFNGMIIGGVALGAENSKTNVQIKKFQYLDKEMDRISLEKIGTPDGTRDGHLSLLFDAGEGTEIKSITMKAADKKGSDTGHGVWTTWKEPGDVGKYLLAVEHDGKAVNSTFQSSLGSFKGVNQFELYASDNNSMKDGEYYYLEIMTSDGLVKSEVTPFVDADTSYAPVIIREFGWVDLNQDKIGSAAFGEDGSKDGHFKLKLAFAQKIQVLSVILRPTDKDGKAVSAGIWRTNRAGVGWLLGLVKGDEIINPEFNKDETIPVGAFQGVVALDLFATNNGSIKNGQHYVIEVETQFGTVKSKPIEFGKEGSIYKDDSVFPFKTISLKLNSEDATVDDKYFKLEVAPFSQEGRTMVPVRFVSEAFGAKVDWDNTDRRVTITKGSEKIELVIDAKQAAVNGKAVLLDSPAIVKNDITLVPVRFVSESLGMKVFFDEGEIFITDAKEQ
ncbi:Copper amine oxidase N-terminal domain-containing protein [Paenibacillus sp. UNCCL117]|uniref:copper amine oxidase N-terminal domain-containing protein n=1 Tax=unclassified Paenibacillus TaxID=185978 RepID=UPI00088ED7B8|nr:MULTISPECIES: copper amine oxidase N-terminal domain-containing protein [unclassified Paenibacillus]SDC27467.1 Copper amine oxidase N-terminal domain-containing protein [Paenibacillus sp. cl123]SFW20339.1 Copper amine oxidase N-terminal domain-containing protein [Paenibacillus sp. UNCCL117]